MAKKLSAANIRGRERAAEEEKDVDWNQMMFTDETDLQVCGVGGNPGGVIRKKDKVGDRALMKEKSTANYSRVHAWAGIGYSNKKLLILGATSRRSFCTRQVGQS